MQPMRSPQGRRAGLTRARVLDAAIELIDRDGLESFSLRRLACELGVEPMSLYNHVASKDDLLDGVVEVVMAKLAMTGPLSGTWEDQIRQAANAFRDVLLSHPQVSILVLTRRVLTDRPLDVLREAISPFISAGLEPADALVVLRAFTAFLTGTILRELGADMSFAAVDSALAESRVANLADSMDHVVADSAHEIARIDHHAVFQRGLGLFIAGLSAELRDPGHTHSAPRTRPSSDS